jgi:phosphatidyl-myo-inositol alpha-mannosyltransferase
MRIGIATEYYYPSIGGVQEHVHHFAREARRLGHAVKIVTSEMPDLPAPEGDAAGPDVLRIARSRPLFKNGSFGRVSLGPCLAGAVRETLARERFDVVHVHCPLTPVLPFAAVHYADCPVVGTFHTHFRPSWLFALTRGPQQRYLDRLDAAVAVSRACLSAFEGRLRADFTIIPNGVDVERFRRGRPLRRFEDGRLNVLWVGRLEPRNGLDRLLAAFVALRAQAEARLLVVGDGPLRPCYEAMVPAELREDVVFAGRVLEERPDWYASADVYCAPASIASFGVTLLEAMAAGRPILASDIAGFREVMTHGAEGELLSPDDVRGWARALARLARDPARREAYGEQGRRTVQRYAWPRVTAEVLGLYRSIGVAG